MMKNPRRARVRAETRTCGTDSPSRSKSRALSITPSHRPQKRRLDDGLQAHAIQPTRESSEDVTRTLDAPPSKVRSDIFPYYIYIYIVSYILLLFCTLVVDAIGAGDAQPLHGVVLAVAHFHREVQSR